MHNRTSQVSSSWVYKTPDARPRPRFLHLLLTLRCGDPSRKPGSAVPLSNLNVLLHTTVVMNEAFNKTSVDTARLF